MVQSSVTLTIMVLWISANAADIEEVPFVKFVEEYNKNDFENFEKNAGGTGYGTLHDEASRIFVSNCINNAYLENKEQISPVKVAYNQVWIRNCNIPPRKFVEIFEDQNINVTAVEVLFLIPPKDAVLEKADYTEGLNLKTLIIDGREAKDYLSLNENFITPLTNLNTLILWGSKLPGLSEETRLKSLFLNRTVIPKWDGYCRNLEMLSIANYDFDVPNKWPENCSQLTVLHLVDLTENVRQNLLSSGINRSCQNLNELILEKLYFNEFPVQIMSESLIELQLPSNNLLDSHLVNFPRLPKLFFLNLVLNQLSAKGVVEITKQVPALNFLFLNSNVFMDFCTQVTNTEVKTFASLLPDLIELSMSNMIMSPHCLESAHFSKLKFLSLKFFSSVETLLLDKFPKTNASELSVYLNSRKIYEILCSEDELIYERENNSSKFYNKLIFYLDPIDCDCKYFKLSKCLHHFSDMISFPELICKNSGRKFMEEPQRNLNCVKNTTKGCIIREYLEDTPNTYTFECNNTDVRIYNQLVGSEEYRGYIVGLKMSDNNLTTIEEMDIADSVQWIDLRRNLIPYFEETDLARLFQPGRRVWLSQNPLICVCERKYMIEKFIERQEQIADFDELACVETGEPLKSISTFDICQYARRVTIDLILAITFPSMLFVIWLVIWRFRLQIKIYLYSRGWCLFWLSEEDLDSDRPYDAFLSFSHEDEDYVLQELLPKLESEPYCYRICVHYRDWRFGEFIPVQIMQSVALSKRTIIVLSRSFVQSMWGTLEFRYAMVSATKEGRLRLLVLILDDVLEEPLSPEIQGYLEYNTYLRCDDPWFWEKLQYAMPRRKRYAMVSATKEGRLRLLVLILDDVLEEPLSPEIQGYLEYNTYLRCDDPWFWEKLQYAMPRRKRSPDLEEPATGNQPEEVEMASELTRSRGIDQGIVEEA